MADYQLRGELLSGISVLDFFTHTYDSKTTSTPSLQEEDALSESVPPSKRGRPRSTHVAYLPSHPRAKKADRVVRSANHRHIPNFIGKWFPSNVDNTPLYCASMLMLLKPWRRLETDLKFPNESWQTALDRFLQTNPASITLLSNIQYYHDARISADDVSAANKDSRTATSSYDDISDSLADDVSSLANIAPFMEPNHSQTSSETSNWREEYFAHTAVESARAVNIFDKVPSDWSIDQSKKLYRATDYEHTTLLHWMDQMKAAVRDAAHIPSTLDSDLAANGSQGPMVEPLAHIESTPTSYVPLLGPEQSISNVDHQNLNTEQKRAYDIITWHLDQTLQHRNPPPLRMLIYGEGGTGKSVVIQNVTKAFEARGRPYLLLKASYTGIAASLIDGKTCHTIAQISISHRGSLGPEAKKKLHDIWQYARYLIIDEYSMLSRPFLATLSKHISIATLLTGSGSTDSSFGGINVILCGDLHQFPPVAVKNGDPLFHPVNLTSQDNDSSLGRKIYEEFTTVVILREQKRTNDQQWCSFLQRLRHGCVKQEDLRMLRSLIVDRSSDPKDKVDFNTEPWASAPLITSRHRVRNLWNKTALRKWCQRSGQQLIVCRSQDTIQGDLLSDLEQDALKSKLRNERRQQRKDLPEELELAIGMQVMVTTNIETDLDIANRARGEIVDIILDSREPPLLHEPVVHLTHLPSYILVKLKRTRAPQLEGLDYGVIPVQAASQSLQVSMQNAEGQVIKKMVSRKQYPVTGAYAFTDYRSQGQTLPYVIVDIATPPSGRITLFNLYVALSRSTGPSSIRLLRDFNDDLFKQSHDPALISEDGRLEKLDKKTISWWQNMQSYGLSMSLYSYPLMT